MYDVKFALVLLDSHYEELNKKIVGSDPLWSLVKKGELNTPDETYVMLYAECFPWSPDNVNVGIIEQFIKEHRHAFIRIGLDDDFADDRIHKDIISFDSEGSDEEFEYMLDITSSIEGLEDFGIKSEDNKVLRSLYAAINYLHNDGVEDDVIIRLLDTDYDTVKKASEWWGWTE